MGNDLEPLKLTSLEPPEPTAIKLEANRTILPLAGSLNFTSAEEACDAPLAKALFAMEPVERVTLEGSSVTVFLAEGANKPDFEEEIIKTITGLFESGQPPVSGDSAPKKKSFSFGFKQIASRPKEEQVKLVKDLFDNEINPAVSAHGGFFTLIDINENNVYVELGGACQGCGMANVTLKQGVEERLREVLPEMEALIDTTDHASGNNPYYTPGK